jgi:alkylation response protein AidB-like acyl-CoA dehydrogenase
MTTTNDAVIPYTGVSDAEFARWVEKARTVANQLAATALERDRANRDPVAELSLLRDSGLLGFATPREFGGAGGSLVQALQISRIIASADGSIGQLIAYHYSNGVWVYILGTSPQWERVARGVSQQGWFQGGVSNPRDPRTEVEHVRGGYRITGKRTFATGASVAQIITVSVWDGPKQIHFLLPPGREGITFAGDWDNLGQRLTASGTVLFKDVAASDDDLLTGLDEFPGNAVLRNGLRSLFSQLIFVNFYLGIAEGALAAATAYVRKEGRPWPESGLDAATKDPYHLLLLGRLSAGVAAGIALADKAAARYETVLAAGAALDETLWGELAVLVDQAKVVADAISLEVTNSIFQVTGARSTSNKYGLDIFWRNVRTHTLHDPVTYRAREIGDYVLNRKLPRPRELSPPPSGLATAGGPIAAASAGTAAA